MICFIYLYSGLNLKINFHLSLISAKSILHPVSFPDHVLDVAKKEQISVLDQTVWTPIPCVFHISSSITHSTAALLHSRPLSSPLFSSPLLSLPFSPSHSPLPLPPFLSLSSLPHSLPSPFSSPFMCVYHI